MTDITCVKLASVQQATVLPLIQNWSSAQLLHFPFIIMAVFIKVLKNPHCHHQDQLETGFHGNRSGLSSWSVDAEQNSPSSNPSLTLLSSCHPVIIWLNILQHFQRAIDKATWGSTSITTFLLHPHLDSIAASLFVWNWLSRQIVSIRWRGPNNDTDTEATCLV